MAGFLKRMSMKSAFLCRKWTFTMFKNHFKQLTKGIGKSMKRRIKVDENMTDTPCSFCIAFCTLGCYFINSLFKTPVIIKNIFFHEKFQTNKINKIENVILYLSTFCLHASKITKFELHKKFEVFALNIKSNVYFNHLWAGDLPTVLDKWLTVIL